MVVSEVKETKERGISNYPYLMTDGEIVVLMAEFATGIVVGQILLSSVYEIGHFSDDWDMEKFKFFYGEVKLIGK